MMTAFLPLLAAGIGVSLCRAQEQPSAAATVVTLVGNVSVLLDNSPWALREGDSVRPRQVIVTGPDGFAEFKVAADGSTFQVFANSRVVFRENPANWRDLLDVFIGQIKVHIQKLGNQPNPNSVRTPTAVISVRGTIFDVVVEEDTDTTFVSVDEGQVEVANLTYPSGRGKLLNPGESIRVIKNVPLAKTVDKGSVMQGAIRAAAEALYQVILRTGPSAGGGSPGGTIPSGGASGDKPKPGPPTTTPPPPAPAPPSTLPPPPPPPPGK
jgi:ferric-dicitrate binding protein FerR (iron transport regulator)